jgi:hypothetical protein
VAVLRVPHGGPQTSVRLREPALGTPAKIFDSRTAISGEIPLDIVAPSEEADQDDANESEPQSHTLRQFQRFFHLRVLAGQEPFRR